MNYKNIIGVLGMGLTLTLSGCSGEASVSSTATSSTASSSSNSDPASSETSVVATEVANETVVDKSVPDLTTVLDRCRERWEVVVAADWIQAFDFNDPRAKELEPLGSFLQGKEHHEYRNPSKPNLIGTEGDLAYMELAVLWEPHHPIIQTVSNKPEDMTQELHMVETWRWVDGEWYFVGNERQSDFHKAHPQIKERQKRAGE